MSAGPWLSALLLLLGLAGCGSPTLKEIGAACSKPEDCASARCHEQLCKPAHPSGLGATCLQNLDCRSEHCQGGACGQGIRAAGATCDHWELCASSQCVQGKCGGSLTDAGRPDADTTDAGLSDRSSQEGPIADRSADRVPAAADLSTADQAKVLDLCEKLLQAEGVTCKPLAVQTITTNQLLTAGCYQAQDLVVDSAGTLRLQSDLSGTGKGATIIAKTITVEMGGVITADSEGYGAGAGPGHGSKATSGLSSGGGHGGTGGPIGDAPGGLSYGSLAYPVQPGSGAGPGGGKGGGAIRLCAATRISVDGFLHARGQTSSSGGSGGSLLLISPVIGGGGSIDASGGKPTSVICGGIGGGGGGGRVALRTTSNTFTGSTLVAGGTTTCYSGNPSGQLGTLFKGGLP